MAYNDEGSQSRFNAGIALTERIDALQRAINAAKFNPFMRNFETGTFNYEILITCLDNMIAEGWDKFSSTEKEHCLRMLEVLNNLKQILPPISFNKDGEYKINMANYNNFINFFGKCERKIKEYYGNHDLNSPKKDDDDGL